MNTQFGNNGPGMGQPPQPWGAWPQQPYNAVPPQPYGGGPGMSPAPKPVDPDKAKRKKTIMWIVIVAILDLLLFLLWLLLPSRCSRPRSDNSDSDGPTSEISEASDISEVVDSDSGELQFGIEWSRNDRVDMDAHCLEPNGNEIYWEAPTSRRSGGRLNIDNRENDRGRVEHITWSRISRMPDGDYLFYVQNFTGGRNSGVKAMLKAGDNTYTYRVTNINSYLQDVQVATVTISNGQVANIHNYIQPE